MIIQNYTEQNWGFYLIMAIKLWIAARLALRACGLIWADFKTLEQQYSQAELTLEPC